MMPPTWATDPNEQTPWRNAQHVQRHPCSFPNAAAQGCTHPRLDGWRLSRPRGATRPPRPARRPPPWPAHRRSQDSLRDVRRARACVSTVIVSSSRRVRPGPFFASPEGRLEVVPAGTGEGVCTLPSRRCGRSSLAHTRMGSHAARQLHSFSATSPMRRSSSVWTTRSASARTPEGRVRRERHRDPTQGACSDVRHDSLYRELPLACRSNKHCGTGVGGGHTDISASQRWRTPLSSSCILPLFVYFYVKNRRAHVRAVRNKL